jgi:hypothetical protein
MSKEIDIREAVGVFRSETDLQAAIDELMSSGFDRAEISLLASEHVVEQKLGHRYEKVAETEDDAEIPRCCYVSPESVSAAEGGLIGGLMYVGAIAAAGAVLVSGGALATALAGMVVAGGGGALIGSLLARLVGERHAEHLQEQLEHGGLVLWVRTWNADDESRAVEILKRHSGADVHVHGRSAAA